MIPLPSAPAAPCIALSLDGRLASTSATLSIMSKNVPPTTLASRDISSNRPEKRNTMDLSIEQPSYVERDSGRQDTDNADVSASTFVSESQCEGFATSIVNPQCWVRSDTTLPHHATEAKDAKARSLEEQGRPGWWQRFCLDWLTTYRVLTSSVVAINLGLLISEMTVTSTVEASLTATAANIMVAVLLRKEEIINASFRLVSKLPATLPRAVRKTIGDLHHYGGLHIGCALSAMLWYCMFAGRNTVRVVNLRKRGNMTTILWIDLITAWAALLTIILVCATAIPPFRVRFHNTFEATHRFGGWAALVVLWVHAGIATLTPDASIPLYAHPSIWLLAATTLLLIIPWLRISRVPVAAFPISAREVQLTFPYPEMPYTSTIRTSTAPWTEWHAFATIPISSTACKIIISQAGDWTKSIIASPPTKLWIRRPPTLNFLAFAPLFTSLLLVATGAGIGPMLSLLTSPTISRMLTERRKIKVMWCTYDPSAAHWAFALDAIRTIDSTAAIFDSKAGRPDLAFEARWLAQTEHVEAVMVVSNPPVTKAVVDACKLAGLAAYGAVFDS